MKSFVCKNTECSAPENKKVKAYPSAMDCPFCDVPLVEIIAFSESELKLLRSLPYVIAYPLKRAIAENHVPTKITLLRDTFLNYLKYLGLITASEFFNSDLKDKKMVALFQQALAEPSFGSWNQYIRETLSYLKENKHHFFCPDLMAYYELVETDKKRKLFKGEIEFIDGNGDVQLKKQEATAIGMLINFRNRYLGHGLTLDEEASKKLWDEYYPIFSLLLDQLDFANKYPMFKHEHGETYLLQTSELQTIEKGNQTSSSVWIESPEGEKMNILPFFVVPGELSLGKEDKEQILTYESYTGKTIKFFSPEGTEKQTSGKVLEKLNLLLRDKQKELPFAPDTFTKEVFLHRIADENKLILDTLTAEKKYIPGVYVHREEMEIKLREWIGARANIFFIAAEAGSGKTNLLIEMQKQYAAQNLSVLFIRAARMEKPSLRAQIAYLLNIQPELSIEQYPSIAGTQANPTFIFIDGLNEALQAESIWQEILNISKISVPGSLKFVVSSRANSSADINGFAITDADELYIYGEKKEGHTGLGAYVFWLTALNMAEMKNAWQAYALTNKNKYKPQFSFDDLATFDRSIYNLISNPLVLRIFLETYHNKTLPKNGDKHLNIWQDWLVTFSKEEITFLKLLTKSVWDKGENELSLDDLLNNPQLKQFLTSDLINAPYPRLKNLGWISRYTKDFNACLSFTVEGFLLYLLGSQMMEEELNIEIDYIKNVLDTGTTIQKSAIEVYLRQMASNGALDYTLKIIDDDAKYHFVCITPIIVFIKSKGIKHFLDLIFINTTENDFSILIDLQIELLNLGLNEIRNELLITVIKINSITSKSERLLYVVASECHPTLFNSTTIEKCMALSINQNDDILLAAIVNLYLKVGNFTKALNCAKIIESIYINKNTSNYDKATNYLLLSKCYEYINDIGNAKKYLFKYNKTTKFNDAEFLTRLSYLQIAECSFEDCQENSNKLLNTTLNQYGLKHSKTIGTYKLFGLLYQQMGDYNESIDYYKKCLEMELEIFGTDTVEIADTYNNMGMANVSIGNFEFALRYFNKAIQINLSLLGEYHPSTASCYSDFGYTYYEKGDYDKSIDYFDMALRTNLEILNYNHPNLAVCYMDLGNLFFMKKSYQISFEYFTKTKTIFNEIYGEIHLYYAYILNNLAMNHFQRNEITKAEEYLEVSNRVFKDNFPSHLDYNSIKINIGLLKNSKNLFEDAYLIFKDAFLSLYKATPNHPDTGKALLNYIFASIKCEKFKTDFQYLKTHWDKLTESNDLEYLNETFKSNTNEINRIFKYKNAKVYQPQDITPSYPIVMFVIPIKYIR